MSAIDPAQIPADLKEPAMEAGQPPDAWRGVNIEITDVQRLSLQPGDRLIVKIQRRIRPQDAEFIKSRVRAVLELPDDVPILILDEGMTVSVANA